MTTYAVNQPVRVPDWCRHHDERGTITQVARMYDESDHSVLIEYRIVFADGSWCWHKHEEVEALVPEEVAV